MMRIRRYRSSDHDEMIALHALAISEVGAYHGSDDDGADWDADLDRIEEVYLNGRGEFLVGVDEEGGQGRIVAMGAIRETDAESAEVRRIRVHPESRRQGLGSAILRALIARARGLGYGRLYLETSQRQRSAQALYEKFGFRRVSETSVGGIECFVYEKRLDEREPRPQKSQPKAAPERAAIPSLRFDILTLFPGMFAPLGESILKRARERNLIDIQLHDIRSYSTDKHHSTDDLPYGGGAGMVMSPDPVFRAVESVLGGAAGDAYSDTATDSDTDPKPQVILMTPQGRPFSQRIAHELARKSRLILVCGHYEGFDERIREHLVTDELSIGDYVLTGGELAAMVVVDAVARLVPGVLGDDQSIVEESHSSGLLEYPHYTRPADYRGWKAPEILLSGDHKAIARYRREQSLRRTFERRPDLLEEANLSNADRDFIARLLGARKDRG